MALSGEEFQRMQNQLLELRTSNYQYEEENRRQKFEITNLREKVDRLDKDNQRANKIISKSKKAKDLESLIAENDQLEMKIQRQEEEFRLQNETMMQELSRVCDLNEQLQKVNESTTHPAPDTDSQTEIRRQAALITALEKNLKEIEKKNEISVSKLQEKLKVLAAENSRLSNASSGEGGNETDCTEQGSRSVFELLSESEQRCSDLEKELLNLADVKVHLDTESEENNLLVGQLNTLEASHKEETAKLQDEVKKLTEKLKKKQESLVQLQVEREKQYISNQEELGNITSDKDAKISALQDQLTHMQAALSSSNDDLLNYRETSGQTTKQLEETISTLKRQVNDTSTESSQVLEVLTVENNKFKNETATLHQEKHRVSVELQKAQDAYSSVQSQFRDLKQDVSRLSQRNEDFNSQLQESQHSNMKLADQLNDAIKERDKEIQNAQELGKLAEKRKMMLDDMAIELQKQTESHQNTNRELQDRLARAEEQLLQKQNDAKSLSTDLKKLEEQLSSTQGDNEQLLKKKGWLERTLQDTEESIAEIKSHHSDELSTLKQSHDQHIESVEKCLEERDSATSELKQQLQEVRDQSEQLKHEIKDRHEEKRIVEKKAHAMMKDLKRQLHTERKRAEKLQAKLQEFLTDKDKLGLDALYPPSELMACKTASDTASVSSYGGGRGDKENSSFLSYDPASSPIPSFNDVSITEETEGLLARVAELQQDKWQLEEKVQYLEDSTSSLADDLMKKSAVIKEYIMDHGRIEHQSQGSEHRKPSLRKVVGSLVKKEDSTTQEVNKRLQLFVEETLVKNIQLQKDLDVMSDEVVRANKQTSSNSSSNQNSPSKHSLNSVQSQP